MARHTGTPGTLSLFTPTPYLYVPRICSHRVTAMLIAANSARTHSLHRRMTEMIIVASFFKIAQAQLNSTIMTESPLRNILLMKRSLLTLLPFFPSLSFGVSVHISLTFSSTMLQCLSKAFTLASSLRLLRHEIRTWVWLRTAVWRSESGPEVNSCVSSSDSSYSVSSERGLPWSSLQSVSGVRKLPKDSLNLLDFGVDGGHIGVLCSVMREEMFDTVLDSCGSQYA